MSLTDQQRDEIVDAIFAGKKIQAIKIYRDATNGGLKEAKEFIETLTESLREEYPDKVPSSAAGCGAAALLLAATGVSAVLAWLT